MAVRVSVVPLPRCGASSTFSNQVGETSFEGGEGIFGAETAGAAMSGEVEGGEVGCVGWVGGGFAAEYGAEEVGSVGNEAVDAEGDEGAHGGGVVGGPGDDADVRLMERSHIDGWVRAEEGCVFRGEGGGLRTVDLGVGFCRQHKGEVGVGRQGEVTVKQ